jgi:hypothetical protein
MEKSHVYGGIGTCACRKALPRSADARIYYFSMVNIPHISTFVNSKMKKIYKINRTIIPIICSRIKFANPLDK